MYFLKVLENDLQLALKEYRIPPSDKEGFGLFFIRPQHLSEWPMFITKWLGGDLLLRSITLGGRWKLGFFTYISLKWVEENLAREEEYECEF